MKAFWGECSPFSSPSIRLFSSTYRSGVKGEGKKAKNSGRARMYAHARNLNKTFVYAFLDKYRETGGVPLPLAPNGQGGRGRSAQKRHIGKRAGHFPMCSFAKGKGKRELKPKGISGGVLIEQCVVLSSSVVHVVLCRVDGCGHLHSVLQLLIR